MTQIFRIKPMDLGDIVDKLASENYIRVSKEQYKEMKQIEINQYVARGYAPMDLGGLFPDKEDYIYFIPYTIYKK